MTTYLLPRRRQSRMSPTRLPETSKPSEPELDLKAPVEGDGGVFVIRGGGNTRGWNGIHYKTGMSGKNVGAKELSMNVATIPPGGVAFAHIHVGFEVMLYILEG